MARGFAAFDRTGHLDSPTEQQQLLSQRGLAGIGVADDGKGAPVTDFAGNIGHKGSSDRCQWGPGIISHAARCLDGCSPASSVEAVAIIDRAVYLVLTYLDLRHVLVGTQHQRWAKTTIQTSHVLTNKSK